MGCFSLLEQVTRVELAGSSLGSCRHTARRHLLIFAPQFCDAPVLLSYYTRF